MARTKLNWLEAKAPDLAAVEAMAIEALEGLPAEFRDLCGDVVILVDDYAAPDVLKELGLASELDLMGLYSGVALPYQDSVSVPHSPSTVHLYRVPMLLYWAEHDETFGHLVRHVLIHEIGHHFGLSDEAMHRIEDEADKAGE